jgi:hypothetical protein
VAFKSRASSLVVRVSVALEDSSFESLNVSHWNARACLIAGCCKPEMRELSGGRGAAAMSRSCLCGLDD